MSLTQPESTPPWRVEETSELEEETSDLGGKIKLDINRDLVEVVVVQANRMPPGCEHSPAKAAEYRTSNSRADVKVKGKQAAAGRRVGA
jgi:hypothetical protein